MKRLVGRLLDSADSTIETWKGVGAAACLYAINGSMAPRAFMATWRSLHQRRCRRKSQELPAIDGFHVRLLS